MDWRKVALVGTPLAAFSILGLALRSGAPDETRAAIVYGAPPAKSALGLAWQVFTVDEAGGVRQPVAIPHLSITARAKGREVSWDGSSNVDGIAEAWLELPGITRDDRVELVVRDAKLDDVLAQGVAKWASSAWVEKPASLPWARAGRREGEVLMDVAIYGQRLPPSFPTPIWIRATSRDGKALANTLLTFESDGLKLSASTVTTDERGFAQVMATALMHFASLGIKGLSEAKASGDWAGTLPTAPGGSHAGLPLRLVPTAAHTFELVGASAHHAYIEIDDAAGRAYADTIALVADTSGTPRATFDLPKLSPGLYWVVTSGTPNGAETINQATIVEPFFVAETDDAALDFGAFREVCTHGDPKDAARALGPCGALSSTSGGFARWVALEGFASKHAGDAARRRRGMRIALGALVVASILETLIIVTGVRDAKRKQRASAEGSSEEMKRAAPRTNPLTIVIGVLVALLGFALVAMLVLRAA